MKIILAPNSQPGSLKLVVVPANPREAEGEPAFADGKGSHRIFNELLRQKQSKRTNSKLRL
jgi:hypothetical protein